MKKSISLFHVHPSVLTDKILMATLFFMMIFGLLSLTACGKDDEDEPDNEIVNPGGGSSSTSYSLKQLQGHWVEADTWRLLQSNLDVINNNSFSSNEIMSFISPVLGFYIDGANSMGYELYIEATTTKYSNNDVAGNKIIASWRASDGVNVYVMNVSGSKNKSACSMSGNNIFDFKRTSYTVTSTSEMIASDGTKYIKVNL